MSQLFNYSGDDDFYPMGAEYFMPFSHHSDVFSPCKRARISSPIVPFGERSHQKKQTSMDSLPDECLFEILRRLSGGKERSSCAFVSKRFLNLVSNIQIKELRSDSNDTSKDDGFLNRSLEGKRATDVRLAAIAVGTSSRGGLGKLTIKGTNASRGVTIVGLKAVASCCPSLKSLTLWNVPTIGDEGLIEIAKGCNNLEKLDLSQCPMITDKGLIAIANGCPNLNSLSIDSCQFIGNEGLQAIGRSCGNLNSVSITDCPLVRDSGVASLLSSDVNRITKMTLQGLNVSDVSLAVIGHYGLAITDLTLSSLLSVTERGFWCMGNGRALQFLKSLTVSSCRGVTDLGLESVAKGSPNLKSFCLRKCAFLSDNGLVSFAGAAQSIESLQLDECQRITQYGFFGLFINCSFKLKSVSVSNCFGIKDMPAGVALPEISRSALRSLTIQNCPLFGDVNLALLSKFCAQLQFLDLTSLSGISDDGVVPLIESSDAGLEKVILGGCVNLTDETVLSLTRAHGGTLELINLKNCGKITDASLIAIANYCLLLNDLDVSRCAISDVGISSLSRSNQLVVSLRIFALAGCVFLSNKCLAPFAKLGRSLVGLNLQHCNGISSSVIDMLSVRLYNCDILA